MSTGMVSREAADNLAALDHAHQADVAARTAELVCLARACDLHRVDASIIVDGAERLVSLGGDGTPLVGEFLAAEIGALLQVSPASAQRRLGQALNLRHRHPRLWELTVQGLVDPRHALMVADACAQADLSMAACAVVDRNCAVSLAMQPIGRLWGQLAGWIAAADPERARDRAERLAGWRGVVVDPISDGATGVHGRLDARDGIALDDALAQLAQQLPAGMDVNVRRAASLGMLARWATGQEPLPPLTDAAASTATTATTATTVGEADSDGVVGEALFRVDADGTTIRAAHADAQRFGGGPCDSPAPGEALAGEQDEAKDPFTPGGTVGSGGTAGSGGAAGSCGCGWSVFAGMLDHMRCRPREVVVHLDGDALADPMSGVARIEGWGVVLAGQLRHLLADSTVIVRPVLDPHTISHSDSYRVPDRMRRWVEVRNPVDVFPFGTRAAKGCEQDHTVPFDPDVPDGHGQTRPNNLGPLSGFTHRAKTHGGWRVEQPVEGVYYWESPAGYQYLVSSLGTIRVRRPAPRGDEWWTVEPPDRDTDPDPPEWHDPRNDTANLTAA